MPTLATTAPSLPSSLRPSAAVVPQRSQNLATGKGAAGKGRSTEGLQDSAPHREPPGDAAAGPVHQGVGRRDRRQRSTSTVETPTKYYGSAIFRELGLAGRRDEHGRLRCPLGAERLPRGTAADATTPRPARAHGTAPGSTTRPTTSSPSSTSPPWTSPASGPSQSRSRTSFSTRHPIIYPYFYNYLAATQKNVTGVYPTAAQPVLPLERRHQPDLTRLSPRGTARICRGPAWGLLLCRISYPTSASGWLAAPG